MPLAFVIAGHHAGLPNWVSDSGSYLKQALVEGKARLNDCEANIPDSIAKRSPPTLPDWLRIRPKDKMEKSALKRRMDLWTRFLFSALIDADRRDTADHPVKVAIGKPMDGIATLRARCDTHIDAIVSDLKLEQSVHAVNQARLSILKRCRETSVAPTGVFSLNVPTGGGKTLSGMSFALNHAERHGMRRVIVVIPYTSIIEQNAQVYRDCLGAANVLEHHSNLDLESERNEKDDEITRRHQLAAENWDAPVIVTTTVQFFETLFTHKTSKTRKLHNAAKSVIVLDEVQTLPPGLLAPILDALGDLVAHYGCSVVLSTATPPALQWRGREKRFEIGLRDIRPIIPNAEEMAVTLKRVTIEWPEADEPVLETPDLAERMARHPRALCVVHRRRDARELAEALTERTRDSVFHLSALMCPKHRLAVIEKIRKRLADDAPCRVVSTLLIEAGVDLDFPVVYRALAGLDSVVQAAGRCNREGKLENGRVIVFRSSSRPPAGAPRASAQVTDSLLKDKDGALDALNPEICETFFQQFYFSQGSDVKNINALRAEFKFTEVGKAFRMIEDGFTHTIIVPWRDGAKRLDRLRHALDYDLPARDHLRALQPYTVSVYEQSLQRLQQGGALKIDERLESMGIYALNSTTHSHIYSERYGLIDGDEPPQAEPEGLIL